MNTRKTIHKVYLAWDFKKEELWLNEMAAEGWALEHAAFCSYTFVRCEPGEYIIRMEMNADRDYRSFVEETGAEYVGGCRIHPFSPREFSAPYNVPAARRTRPPESCSVCCIIP